VAKGPLPAFSLREEREGRTLLPLKEAFQSEGLVANKFRDRDVLGLKSPFKGAKIDLGVFALLR